MNEYKIHARGWIERHAQDISDWHQIIWRLAEPAWREYRSAAWYVDRLRKEGFTVEEGSAGMPTAFCAVWENGKGGPTVGAYAEYDATPANSQGLCRIRRHPRQLAGASALRMPPRRAQPLRRRAHRPPFRARHGLARRGAGRQGRHAALRHPGPDQILWRACGKDVRLKAPARRQRVLRRRGRLHQLPPELPPVAVQHRLLGHPLREQLWPRVHLRVHPPRNVGRGARPYAHAAPAGGGQSPRRARCRVPHVYDQPLHQYLHVASLGRMVYQ